MTLADRFQKYVVNQRDEPRGFCRIARNDRYCLYIPMIYPDGVASLIAKLQTTVVPGSPAAAQAVWGVVEEVFVRNGLGDHLLALEGFLGGELTAALTAQSSELQIEDDAEPEGESEPEEDTEPEGEDAPEGEPEPEGSGPGLVNPAAAAIAVINAGGIT